MFSEINEYVHINLSKLRLEHSLSTSLICVELCSRFGLDDKKGKLAGLAHDIFREVQLTETIIQSLNDGYPISAEENKNQVLLHGRLGAFFLKNKFGVDDEEILQAIRWHTSGHPDMGKLGQVLFVADYIEPGRKHISAAFKEKISNLDLDNMTLVILNKQIAYLRSCGYHISEVSMLLHEKLSNSGKKN